MRVIIKTSQLFCHCGLDPQSHKKRLDREEIAGQARNDKITFHS